jgi:hypothetical protein
MDGYPPAYVAHNVPYLLVSGLGGAPQNHADLKAEGVRITSDVPLIESEDAEAIIKNFKDCDADGLAWNGRASGGRNKFKVKTIGRVVQHLDGSSRLITEYLIGIRLTAPQCSTF